MADHTANSVRGAAAPGARRWVEAALRGVSALRAAAAWRKVCGLAIAFALAAGASASAQVLQISGASFPVTQVNHTASQNVTLTVGADSVIFLSFQIAPGYTEYSVSGTLGCQFGTVYTPGQSCTLPINFTPAMPGQGSSPIPIGRSAPLQVTYIDEVANAQETVNLPMTGTGTAHGGVLVPGLISDLVGKDVNPRVGFGGDGGAATAAIFTTPAGIAMDVLGNIYIADSGNNVVRVVYKAGTIPNVASPVAGDIYTIAGVAPTSSASTGGAGTDGVAATSSPLNQPVGIALDATGNLYIADSNNQAVREVNATTGIISTVAGTLNSGGSPGCCFSGDGAAATSAALYYPSGIAVDGSGNLYIADNGNNAVRAVYAAGTIAGLASPTVGYIYTVAGGPSNLAAPNNGDGGLATTANLNAPVAVIVDSAGDIYIADSRNDAVRRVDSATGNISTVFQGTSSPVALAVDASDNIYYTQQLGCPVSQYNPTTRLNMLVAGNGVCTASGDGGAATSAGLSGSPGVVVDGAGNLYLLEADGVRFVDGTQSAFAFGQVNIGPTIPPMAAVLTNNDIVDLANPNNLGLSTLLYGNYPYLAVTAPFATVPYTGPESYDCVYGAPQLDPGQACGFSVSVQATADGTFTDAAGSYYPGPNFSLDTIHLSATVVGSLPTATLTPSSLTMTSVVNEAATSQTLSLNNTSSTPLAISLISSSNYIFSETNNCGTSLAANSSCTITVAFRPIALGAPQTSIITVTDDASSGNGTQTATVFGTGIAPLAVWTTATVPFGNLAAGVTSAPMTATLSNTGTAPLTISGFSISGNEPGQFAILSNACGATLAANASCNLAVTFTPNGSGNFSATLNATDDSGGQRAGVTVQQTAALTGSSSAPAQSSTFSIANTSFASTPIGQSLTQAVLLTLGSPNIVLKSIGIQGPGAEYTVGAITGCAVDGATPNLLGAVCSISVTFAPTLVGNSRNATLLATTIESGNQVPYVFGLHGISTGPIAALTPGIIGPYVASKGSGGGANPLSGMGGQAALASVGFFNGSAMDPNGNLYLSDSYYDVIYKVGTDGIINIYAGTPFTPGGLVQQLSGDGGPAIGATLAYGGPLALDAAGNLYVGDSDGFGHMAIRKIDPGTGTITTVVGGGSGCPAQTDAYGDGCIGTEASLTTGVGGSVTALAFDSAGNLFFDSTSEYPNGGSATISTHAVRRMDAATGIVTLFAGDTSQNGGTGADNGPALGASLSPGALALDSASNLYIVDGGVKVRKVDSSGNISTFAGIAKSALAPGSCAQGTGAAEPSGDGGLATAAGFGGLTGIAIDAANDVYVVDNAACQVRRVDSGTGKITTIAGQKSTYGSDFGDYDVQFGNNDGSAGDASLNRPLDIQLDSSANIYLMEFYNERMINVSESALDFTPIINPNPPFNREGVGVGSVTGPLTTTVLNAGNAGPLNFQAPFITGPAYGISTADYTRDTGAADCISSGAGLTPGTECPVNIDFTPTVAGSPVLDTDTLKDSGAVPAQSISLIGSASGTAPVTLLPSLLAFISAVNTISPAQNFTLTNNTASSLPITSISLVGPNALVFAQTNNCGAALAANSSCLISVTFTPTATGQYLAQVSATYTLSASGFTYPATSTANVVGNTGTAAAHIGQIASLNAIDFANQQVGTTSPAQTATLYSIGSAALAISSITIGGADAAQFAISGTTCPAQLLPLTSCTISVTFTPLSVSPGSPPTPFAARIIIADNAADTPQGEILIGVGIPGAPIPLLISETIHVSDAPTLAESLLLTVAESIHISDAPALAESLMLSIPESIHVSDTPALAGPLLLAVAESIHVSDAPAFAESLLLSVAELIHVSDAPSLAPSLLLSIPETIHVSDAPAIPIQASIAPTITFAPSASIVYGTTLAGELTATASHNGATVAGTFAYTATPTGGSASAVAASTVLPAGSYTLTARFAPANTASYSTATAMAPLTVAKATSSVALAVSAALVLAQAPVTFTATLSSAAGAPTGTVSFFDDGSTTPLGSSAVAAGVATLALSTLSVGAHSITAVYSGDANFAAAASGTVSETVDDFSLNLSSTGGGSTSVTVVPGGTATYLLTVSPTGSATFPAAIALSVSGLPAGATYTLAPTIIAAGAGPTTVTLAIQVPALAGSIQIEKRFGRGFAPIALGLAMLPFFRRVRRSAARLGRVAFVALLLLAGAGAVAGMAGCGGGTGYFAQPQKSYSITVTGTSGALKHSTTLTLTVE